MKTGTTDRITESIRGANQALRDHDESIATTQVRVRQLEEQCASARTSARTAWERAGAGVADGADVIILTATALQRDGEIRALEAAVLTLRSRLTGADHRRDALVFEISVAESEQVCANTNGLLIEWYGLADKFLQSSAQVKALIRDLDALQDKGRVHRERCQALGFPVEDDLWTPEVPLPYGFDFDRFRDQAHQHYLPAYRDYVRDLTPEGRLEKAKTRVVQLLAKVGLTD